VINICPSPFLFVIDRFATIGFLFGLVYFSPNMILETLMLGKYFVNRIKLLLIIIQFLIVNEQIEMFENIEEENEDLERINSM